MGRITVFSLPGCQHCARTKAALTERGLPFADINVSTYQERLKDVLSLVGKPLVPQVFFNDKLIGGPDEVIALLEQWEEEKLFPTVLERYQMEIESQPDPTDPRLAVPGAPAPPQELAGMYSGVVEFLQFDPPENDGGMAERIQQEMGESPGTQTPPLMEDITLPGGAKMDAGETPHRSVEEGPAPPQKSKPDPVAPSSTSAPAAVEMAPPRAETIRTPGPKGRDVSVRDMAQVLETIIPRSDLRYLGRLYKDVFKGSDGVSAIMKFYDLQYKSEAIDFGLSLQKQWKLLDHVKSEHEFGDNNFFFRLQPYTGGTGGQAGASGIGLEKLQFAALSLRSGVEVKDRKYRLKTYKQCFLGKEAVDFFVTSGHAQNRGQALQMGKAMQTQLKLFEHVTKDHEFEDAGLFYRFI